MSEHAGILSISEQPKPYLLGMYEKASPLDLSWEERLRAAHEANFDYVEISIDESDARQARLDWTRKERLSVQEAVKNTGVPLGSMCLSGHRKWPFGSLDKKTRERAYTMMQKAIDLCGDLGIRMIQLAGYDVYYEKSSKETVALFKEGIAAATQMAAKAGVILGFESMDTPFMDTITKIMPYVTKVNSPYLGIYPDVGNLSNSYLEYGCSVADELRLGRGHLLAAHMKETTRGHYRDIPFATGTTDYEGALDELLDQGVSRFVCEMWYQGSPEWKDDIAFANSYVRGKIDAAFERKRA